jgi:molybdopterin molybdotransferase
LILAGAEIKRNQHLISSGTVLQAREVTILATQGYGAVKVRRQPRVAVLATGSELKEVGGSLDKGQLFASNLFTVSHLVKSCGGTARPLGIVGDDLNKLIRTIHQGYEAEVVVTTGGTGEGDKDLLFSAIDCLGGRLLFHGVAMSPGKQTLCALINKTLLIGLPGRPQASFVAFQQLVRPVLLRMLGISGVFLPEITARLRHSVRTKGKEKTLSFLFSRLIIGAEEAEVESLRSTSKGMLSQMLAANSLIKVEPRKKNLQKGERVRVQLLDLGLAGLSYFAES